MFQKKNKKERRNFEFGNFGLRIFEFGTAKTQAAEEQRTLSYLNKPEEPENKPTPAVGNHGNKGHEVGLRQLARQRGQFLKCRLKMSRRRRLGSIRVLEATGVPGIFSL